MLHQAPLHRIALTRIASRPRRSEEELDPVTLHNTALFSMDDDATVGFKKLNFLLQNPPFPPETFGNLLLLYCKHQYLDLAADVLAENAHLTFKARWPGDAAPSTAASWCPRATPR